MAATLHDQSASKLVRAELLKRGWTRHDLAERTRLSPRTVTNVVCGNSNSAVMRGKIEAALGLPVWSTAEAFVAPQTAPSQPEKLFHR